MPTTIEQDAREYGVHVRHGGWRLGLLVARSVEKGAKKDSDKVSADEFARRSGTSADRVIHYLDAWERAADAGYVPHSTDVTPGQDVQLPEDEDGELWRRFYRSSQVGTDRREALEEEARARGVGPSKVMEIVANPKAMAAAIAADKKSADAALDALTERAKKEVAIRQARHAGRPERDETVEEELFRKKAAFERFWGPERCVARLRTELLAIQREARNEWDEEQRLFAAEKLEPHRHTVAMLIDMLRGLDDSALAALLADGEQ